MIGRRDDLIDDDARGDRDRQAQKCTRQGHGQHGSQFTCEAAEAQAEAENIGNRLWRIGEGPVEYPGRGRERTGDPFIDRSDRAIRARGSRRRSATSESPLRRQQRPPGRRAHRPTAGPASARPRSGATMPRRA